MNTLNVHKNDINVLFDGMVIEQDPVYLHVSRWIYAGPDHS